MRQTLLVAALFFAGTLALAQSDFEAMDTDDDGSISKDEFYGYVGDAGIYGDWDLDDNGLIDENEFGEFGLDEEYDVWDTDRSGWLDSGELYDGIYGYYDEDESGHWDGNEWDDAGDAGFWDV